MKCPECNGKMEKDIGTYYGRKTYGYFCWACGKWYWEDSLISSQELKKETENEK